MNTTNTKPSATVTETMFGTERTYTATRVDGGTTRRGSKYAIAVDGERVALVEYEGGRRYWVYADGTTGWEFVTQSDGGKVSDVMEYVARCAVHETVAKAGA